MMYITRFSENVLNGVYASPDVYTPILSKVHISEKEIANSAQNDISEKQNY